MSNLDNLFVIELIFVKESGNSNKYGFTTAEQAIAFLQGEIAAQQNAHTDAATFFGMRVETANWLNPGQWFIRPSRRR